MSVRVGGVGVGVVILVVGFLLWIIASSVGFHLRSPIAVIIPTILYFSSVIYLLNAPKIDENDTTVETDSMYVVRLSLLCFFGIGALISLISLFITEVSNDVMGRRIDNKGKENKE